MMPLLHHFSVRYLSVIKFPSKNWNPVHFPPDFLFSNTIYKFLVFKELHANCILIVYYAKNSKKNRFSSF